MADCLLSSALAETKMVEFDGASFPVAVEQHMQVKVLPVDDQAGYQLAEVLPASVIAMDLLQLKWPKSDTTAVVAVAQSSGGLGAEQQLKSNVAVMVQGKQPVVVELDEFSSSGFVARLCAWPTQLSGAAELIVLVSFSWGWQDASVIGFRISPAGSVTPLDTSGASTLFGWFEAIDLDSDGSYELVTSRNLDGTIGGFFYHAVRAFDAASGSHAAKPEAFKDYFSNELAWLDWVVSTRAEIQGNPAQFLDESGVGPVYRATYQGTTYGFDSIVEVPSLPNDAEHFSDYNAQRREAFELVKAYRDDLAAWLDGGDYPAAWRLSND